ncbi:MAG TPA: hypothetical protein VNU01_03370 [Egibacteraceae bacterium]|nr:hypothetical protein [Egibacteraceae bacterium]
MTVTQIERVWVRPTGSLSYVDDGFVPDPDGPLGAFAPDVVKLPESTGGTCLMLIGEPGLGKSTALRADAQKTASLARSGTDHLLTVNLGSTRQEAKLERNIFGSTAWQSWLSATSGVLHVFLDGLDEALLRVDTVASLLIEGLAEAPIDRLSLRITCRSADRQLALEDFLKDRFRPNGFEIYELLPLRRREIAEAARGRGLDGDSFVTEVIDRRLQALAMSPMTLKMLLDQRCDGGPLKENRAELYEEACLRWCEEPNPQRPREDSRRLSVGERLAVATRIAAATMLSGRSSIRLDERSAGPDEVALNDLAGGQEIEPLRAIHDAFAVGPVEVHETLRTGLFSARGVECVGFAHPTVAEYLAARYLAYSSLSDAQIDDLLFSETGRGYRVIPQLSEIAAWLASQSPPFVQRLLEADPAVLLRGELRHLADEDRGRLVEAFLVAVSHREVDRWDPAVRSGEGALFHGGLADQLRAWIRDRTRDPRTRATACDIARQAGVSDLTEELADVGLDPNEDMGVRVAAVSAVGDLGDVAARRRLVPLALDELGQQDPDDELKGAALLTTWPDVLGPEEVLSALTPAKRDSLFGLYRHFVERAFPTTLPVDALPEALHWAASLPVEHQPTDALSDLREALVLRALDHTERHDVAEALVQVICALLNESVELLSYQAIKQRGGVLAEESTRRRIVNRLVSAVADDSLSANAVVLATPPLLSENDVPFLIDKLMREYDVELQKGYVKLLTAMLGRGVNPEPILEARGNSLALREATSAYFDAVPLHSELARQQRETHRRLKELRRKRNERREPTLDVVARVEEALTAFERGDIDGFWHALYWLEIDGARRDRKVFVSDPRALPGWQFLDDALRTRMVAAAEKYLQEGDPAPERWFGKRILHAPATAGYRALRLLAEVRDDRRELDTATWERWAPAVIGWPASGADDESAFNTWAVDRVIQRAAATSAEWIGRELDRDLRSGDTPFVLHRVKAGWSSELEAAVLKRAKRSPLSAGARAEVLRFLIRHGSEAARQHAERLVTPAALAAGGRRRDLALKVGALLAAESEDAAWSRLWPLIESDADFGKSLITELATGYERQIAPSLTARQVGALYNWLLIHFPPEEDGHEEGAHFISPREEVGLWRDRVLASLTERATSAAVDELARLAAAHTNRPYLLARRAQAAQELCRRKWIAPSPAVIVQMTHNAGRRWVKSAADLRRLLVNTIRDSEAQLQKRSQVYWLWNTAPLRPKPENALSDWLKSHLDDVLRERGIVAGREVQIRPGPGHHMGEASDLLITAAAGERVEGAPLVEVVVEVKGCWHREVETALKTQLCDRYLQAGGRDQGIYVVGWYDADGWDESDKASRSRCRRYTVAELSTMLERQAESVSAGNGVSITAVVLDCSLPPPGSAGSARRG